MQKPPKSTAPGTLVRGGRQLLAKLSSNPVAKAYVPQFKSIHARLKKAKERINDTDDIVVDMQGPFSEVHYRVKEVLTDLQLETQTVVRRDYEDPLYKALFPSGLTALKLLTGEALRADLPRILEQLNKLGANHKLHPFVKSIGDLEKEWKGPAKALAEAEVAHAKANDDYAAMRVEWEDGVVSLHGTMTAKFPRKKEWVETFFPKWTLPRTVSTGDEQAAADAAAAGGVAGKRKRKKGDKAAGDTNVKPTEGDKTVE